MSLWVLEFADFFKMSEMFNLTKLILSSQAPATVTNQKLLKDFLFLCVADSSVQSLENFLTTQVFLEDQFSANHKQWNGSTSNSRENDILYILTTVDFIEIFEQNVETFISLSLSKPNFLLTNILFFCGGDEGCGNWTTLAVLSTIPRLWAHRENYGQC